MGDAVKVNNSGLPKSHAGKHDIGLTVLSVVNLTVDAVLIFLILFSTPWQSDTSTGGSRAWVLHLLALATLLAAVFGLRTWLGWRDARRSEAKEYQRAQRYAAQRDLAMYRSHIAAELHDSVGHGLTAIISLTEGYMQSHDTAELREVLTDINEIARDGLADTRKAVRELADGQDPGCPALSENNVTRHSWDDISVPLGHVRASGLTALLTETGDRPDDPGQAHVAFLISREAITNALRHADQADRVSAVWNHHRDGSIDISISDNGTSSFKRADDDTGTGLLRLQREAQLAGGWMTYGPMWDSGWQVQAHLPSMISTAGDSA